jgi:hypothetical protein
MIFFCNIHLPFSLQKTILSMVLILFFGLSACAQNNLIKKDTTGSTLNPLLYTSFKNSIKPGPNLNERFKSPNNQLMYWPNYHLTAAQVEERLRRYDQPVLKQIAREIAESYINSLLNGKNKKPVVSTPRF